VNKDVWLAIDSDESPTLLVVEPLDGSCSHCGPPYYALLPELRFWEGTTTATSALTLLGGTRRKQEELRAAYDGSRRAVLDNPASIAQGIT
jgi:hypothetical protein